MTLETMQAVVEALAERNVDATLEYPGFIAVDLNEQSGYAAGLDGRSLHFGDANDTISADLVVADEVESAVDSDIPRDSTDVGRIAEFIHATVCQTVLQAHIRSTGGKQ